MSNFAKQYFIKVAGLHLGTTFLEDNWDKDIIGMQDLQSFLEMENVLTLYGVIQTIDDNKRLKFFRTITNQDSEMTVVFSKYRPCIPSDDNLLLNIQTTSFSGSPALALYQSLNSVYTPFLKQKENSNLHRQIANLQNDLRSEIFSDVSDIGVIQPSTDFSSLSVVNSLEHEVSYWNTVTPTSKRDKLTKAARTFFKDCLSSIAGDFSIIDALSINDVEDLLEKSHNVLDDLWRHEPPFPKDRIKHLMDIIGSDVWKFSSNQLKKHDLWNSEFLEIADALLQQISVGQKWLTSCKQLTEIFWPNYPSHPWKENVYQPDELVRTVSLLQKILNIRTLHKQLVRLLTPQEQVELNTKDMFQCFQDVDIFLQGQDLSNPLSKAEKQFEYLIQPAERRVAIKLKKQLATVNANTRQLIYEYSRYSELISRPVLRSELLLERQFLMVSLYDYVKQIQSQAASENPVVSTRYDTPEVVKEITVIRQLEGRANEILKVAQKLLGDLQGYQDLNQVVTELAKDLKQQHNELFEAWSSEIIGSISDNSLSLKESDSVVQFSKQKLMHVNYSPRLVILTSEVRQLKAMGYHIPSLIEETSEHAKKFMKFARTLEQIANFHNTIGDRMIPSQKPMMLASALELSKLVQEQEVVSWGEEKSVAKYVETLKTAVEKLSKENNLLTMYHRQILEKINDLKQFDLIKDYSKWRETGKNIRTIMTQVEDKGFRNMQSWKSDLDKKLSEVLEKQFLESLDTLHLYLPEIHIDLIYRNSKLEYFPNEDSLKKTYEQQLKKFLDIPRNFRAISEVPDTSLFQGILSRNENALKTVSKHTDELFEQLKGVINHWQSWLQLDPLDTTKLTSWQHWDLHFRASKTFGQEIAKLPSTEERVGCFLIGLSRLRSDLESHNRSYWDQLVYSLKDSIAQDVVKLQNYVDHSTAALTRQPVTVDEVGESGIVHNNIMKEAPEMLEVFKEMSKKSQILSSWSREQVSSVGRLKGAWDRLQSLLDNHQHIMAKQMETIKTTLNIDRENLEKEIERFQAKWEEVNPRPHSGDLLDNTMKELLKHSRNIKEKKSEWVEIQSKQEKLMENFKKFSLEEPELLLVKDIEDSLKKEEESWAIFEEFSSEFDELRNEPWIVFRKKIYKLEDFLKKWQEKLEITENTQLVTRLLQEIHRYECVAPSLKYVKGEDFSEKHWIDVFNLLGMDIKPVDQLILNDFLEACDEIQKSLKDLQVIAKKAASEIVVKQALAELDQWDVLCRFVVSGHKDSRDKNMFLIKDFKEILNKIGDNQSLLQSLKNSTDYDSFVEKVTIWENKFADLDYFLSSLAQIQRKWLYLEPIFVSGTLAQEKSRFERIDRDFRHILTFIEKDLRVAALCRYPNLRSLLETIMDQLSRCQISLDSFLKEKREKFPRFLFLSDDDLLEVVGQSSKEHVIQSHLKKIFMGIATVHLSSTGQEIAAMCSSQGETVFLSNPVNIQKPVEEWLNELVKQMQITLKELLVNCQKEKTAPDPLLYPSQVLCLSDSITFTAKCEQAISNMTVPPLLAKYKTQLEHYSSLELNNGTNTADGDILLELKLKALLLDTIHHISVLEELMSNNVTKVSDWIWQKQLRYYANSVGEVTVKMANARVEYSYEYLGNAPKLVRTPLTDRCFLTLTQGIHLGMGGNPYGPAGTGKTESVKALGGLLGRQVLVFNCDEGIDAASMGRILTGLVKTGAWGCFDEFNRLDEATLSAISMLIHAIQVAIRTNKNSVQLLDQEVTANKHCGIFVTLNPAGGGYGGRNKLPDNLKQLFRPVVMTHPDNEEIARALLHCDGYRSANLIARKLVEVFDISSKLLSKQQHYDWGLRSIRTVLSGCGRAMKKFKAQNTDINNSLNPEMAMAIQVLKIDTLSKLSFSDSTKFASIIQDVFREVHIDISKDDIMRKCIEESFEEMGLEKNERQINKCMEFYEQLQQRMGVAIVGPPSSGKTTIRQLINRSLCKLGKSIKSYCVNPKSMSRSQLLGKMDLDTSQWNDGVLTTFSLQVASESADIWSWIICDGDIDPEWVESLNSVLDDNRLLSLPSGWRIQFGPNVNFIFETHDLSSASPATISRMGIIFLSEEDLELENYVTGFVNQLSEEQKPVLEPLISDHFLRAVNWIVRDGDINIPCSRLAIAKTGLTQLADVRSKAHFSVALINGLGQQLQDDFKELFAQQVYEWTGDCAPPLILKPRYNRERDVIDSYYTNPNISIENSSPDTLLIETGQISQYLDTLRVWLGEKNSQNFLIVGPHGSAKTLIFKSLILERTDVELVILHCSGNLLPEFVVTKLSEHCLSVNTHRGKVLKPKKGNLVLHFKNLHLLKPDKWGTNILIEFLSQLIVYRGFFDANVEFVGIENVTITGSLAARNNLSKRFTSIMRIFNVSLPEAEDFPVIVSAYLTAILKNRFPSQNLPRAKIIKISASMISVYDKIRNTFTSIQNKHYIYSPHDVTNWCKAILRYKNSEDKDPESFLQEIVKYEASNIFGNRLVNEGDKEILYRLVNDTLQNHWGANFSASSTRRYYVPVENRSGNLRNSELIGLTKEEWRSMVQSGITQCERDGQSLDLIINDELLDLTASILKTVSCPGGNVLLVGKSGVGRRSALKIASALQSSKVLAPSSEKQPQLNNDLKVAMQYAGVEGEEIYLQIEDYILNEESNLNIFNLLLSSGEVPGLYTPVELESLVKALKEESDRENFDGSLIQFFHERVKQHLHVVAYLDVDNENLWNIFQNCPALLQESSVVWKSDWSSDTIEKIPRILLEKNCPALEKNDSKFQCTEEFSSIYRTMKGHNSTPSRYIAMIKLYENIYDEKLTRIKARIQKLEAGVAKLTEAESLVKGLKEKAAEKQAMLEEKRSKANLALDMISNTMKNANSHKEEMESLKSKTQEENVQLMKRKKEIEAELSEVEPLIEEARSAVGNIKSESLSEIRSLRAPPEIIRDILEGVLRLMGIQDTSWNSMKTFLAKRGIKEEIRSFDASRIVRENRQAVERLMSNKSDSFDAKAARRASVAAAPLAAWVAANVKYSYVMDKILPLEKEQNKLKQNLSNAEAQLGELSAGLLDVDATVAKLKQQLSAFTKEAAEIEIDLNKAQATLGAAEGLVSKLGDEYDRWQKQLQELSEQVEQLPKECLLASAFMTYLSSEAEDKRKEFLTLWCEDLGLHRKIDIELFFSTERERMQWRSEGLSADKMSIQNAVIILKADMVPLLIDPTSSATSWMKRHLRHKNVECTTQNSPKFKGMLELAVRFGKTFIIEEIDTICPTLFQILRKEFINQGERRLIKLNGKLIDYHIDFKLIMCSRDQHLKLPPDISPLVNLMNFTVTHSGLTEQLLSGAVSQENPELETKKQQLLKDREEMEEKLSQLQNELLEALVDCKGDILQDSKLLESLNETKASSEAIAKALKESSEVQSKLQSEYDMYRDISYFGSSLYFACNDFGKCDVIYLLSVTAFAELFLKSLRTFQGIESNLDLQKKHLLHTVYSYMSRGIFKYDRLKFLLHVVHKIYPNEIPGAEWQVFLGNTIPNKNIPEELPPWVPKHCVNGVQNIQSALPEFFKSLKLEEFNMWKNFMNTSICETEIPTHCKLSNFQKVLVIQALRSDRLYSTMIQCVLHITGLKSIDPSVLDLSLVYKESTSDVPILILAVSGTDPTTEVRDLAKACLQEYTEVAMGEGQETKALSALKKCSDSGTWLILKNLHLVTYWLPVLTQNLKSAGANSKFRLWLISEPSSNFNFVLAQNSLKVVYETSQGIKSNLLRSYSTFGSEYVEKLNQNSARVLFVLACLHALLQERRKYIPQGWSKYYDFSDTDLSTSVKLIEDLWHNQGAQIQWNFVRGLTSDAVYGGRIENLDDMEIVRSYAEQYFADEVLSHRWKPFGLEVTLPSAAQFEEYVKGIKQIPNIDAPSAFGLAQNIGRAWEKQTSSKLISELKNFYLSKNISNAFNQDVFQKGLAPFMNIWKKLNQGHDFIRMTSERKVESSSVVETFINEEFDNALLLLQMIHKCFGTLKKIYKGVVVPDGQDLEIGNSLLNYETPKLWLTFWNGPKEPIQYLRNAMNKIIGLSKWKNEKVKELLQKPFSLSTLFHPDAFLASHKQDFSRSAKVPMDELLLQTNWRSKHDSVILTDLLVEGGIFENGALKHCSPNSENINTVPNCYLNWVEKKNVLDQDKYIDVPVYTTSSRDKKIFLVQISCDAKQKDEWIQCGIAFYLEQ
ncbi:dynein cytoplasmic heavy chain beethoven [Leptinotarsa decemlineata]|uniref:dynein cytoplasmic heavy chain beethoven n=1 Tax=Leptinotarsa decemlineata TaxID=7539 RepID=UPI003D30522F